MKLGIFVTISWMRLFTEAQFLDQRPVTGQVVLAQVGQQALPLSNHLHQPALGGEIFFVGLQVI